MDAWSGFKDGIEMTKKYAFPLGTSMLFRHVIFSMARSLQGSKMNTKSR